LLTHNNTHNNKPDCKQRCYDAQLMMVKLS